MLSPNVVAFLQRRGLAHRLNSDGRTIYVSHEHGTGRGPCALLFRDANHLSLWCMIKASVAKPEASEQSLQELGKGAHA